MAAPAGTTNAAGIGVSERLATRIPPAKDGIGSTTVVVIAERRATAAAGMTVPGMEVVTVFGADGSTTTGLGIGVGATFQPQLPQRFMSGRCLVDFDHGAVDPQTRRFAFHQEHIRGPGGKCSGNQFLQYRIHASSQAEKAVVDKKESPATAAQDQSRRESEACWLTSALAGSFHQISSGSRTGTIRPPCISGLFAMNDHRQADRRSRCLHRFAADESCVRKSVERGECTVFPIGTAQIAQSATCRRSV